MKRFVFLLTLICLGCVGPNKVYEPQAVTMGGDTYNNFHSTKVYAGVGGRLVQTGTIVHTYAQVVHEDGRYHLGVGADLAIPFTQGK